MAEQLITLKDVQHVAKLARLAITEEEQKLYLGQLERILEYVSKLKSVNTEGVAPTAHPLETSNVWRDDAAKPFSDIPAVLKNAPESEETFFKVKKVIE